jgi:hypothetical protein
VGCSYRRRTRAPARTRTPACTRFWARYLRALQNRPNKTYETYRTPKIAYAHEYRLNARECAFEFLDNLFPHDPHVSERTAPDNGGCRGFKHFEAVKCVQNLVNSDRSASAALAFILQFDLDESGRKNCPLFQLIPR